MKLAPRILRWQAIVAAACFALAMPLTTSTRAQEGRGDRPRGGWRREGGTERPPRPDGDRRRSREEREGRRAEREAAAGQSATTAAPAATANSFGTTTENDRMRKWASDTVAKHDQNGDKILEGEELAKLGQSSRSADTNSDGKITVDELYQFSSKGSSSTASTTAAKPATTLATSAATTDTAAGPKSRTITNDKRKSFRFKSTKDRINNWRFSSRDANGDGQVSMSEYSRSWSDRTAGEFTRYDKDSDGMITAEEAP